MIDYSKLLIAFELAKKHAQKESIKYEIIYYVTDNIGKIECNFEDGRNFYGNEMSIDILINQLKQLTKSEPKYKIGETVFALNNFLEIVCFEIEGFYPCHDTFSYYDKIENEGKFDFNEEFLFPTRQALIKHQIEYWQKMSCENKHHEFMDDITGYKSICVHCDKNEFQSSTAFAHCKACAEPVDCCDCEEECEHESDGQFKISQQEGRLAFKCIKCGEFYR